MAVTQTAHRIVFVEALLGFGGRFDVPLQQFEAQRLGHFFGQHGFAGAGFTFDQQGSFQGDRRIHGQGEVLCRDVIVSALKFHDEVGFWVAKK